MPAQAPEHEIAAQIGLPISGLQHLDTGQDQKGTEHERHPAKGMDELNTGQDQHATHGECPEHTPEEDSVLILGGHAEGAEEKIKDEDVIQTEGFLDEIAG
jgi:hypothetical protein